MRLVDYKRFFVTAVMMFLGASSCCFAQENTLQEPRTEPAAKTEPASKPVQEDESKVSSETNVVEGEVVGPEKPAAAESKKEFDPEKTFFSGKAPSSIEELREMERKFAEISELVKPATVNIQMGGAQGSGIVVTRDGYILTAAHVIGNPNGKATVTFPDNKKYNATTLGVSTKIDGGILKIDDGQEEGFPFIEMGLSSELKDGQWVMAIGHPGGIDEKRGLVVRVGRILSIDNSTLKGVIQTDCTLVGGDSGGPLVDLKGEVVGIHSRIGMNLWDNMHVPVDFYSEKWDELAQGIAMDATANFGFRIESDSTRIEGVTKDGAAEKAGLKVGDIVKKIGEIEITSAKDLRTAKRKMRPNMKIKVVVERDGEDFTFDMTVGPVGSSK